MSRKAVLLDLSSLSLIGCAPHYHGWSLSHWNSFNPPWCQDAEHHGNIPYDVCNLLDCHIPCTRMHVREGPLNLSTLGDLFWEDSPAFKVDARILEHLDSFEHLCELLTQPCSVDLDDNDLMKFAKSLPHLHSLLFYSKNNRPKCTFTGIQHLIWFCPKLESLTLCVDVRQIPVFATQPDGEYPLGLHLTTLTLCHSPVLDAGAVASYLTMLFPVLTNFWTINEHLERVFLEEEEQEVISYCKI